MVTKSFLGSVINKKTYFTPVPLPSQGESYLSDGMGIPNRISNYRITNNRITNSVLKKVTQKQEG